MILCQMQTHQQSNLAGWILLTMTVVIILTDYWLYKTGRPTFSQWLKRKTKYSKYLKIFGAGLIGLLLWHLFLGGPF